MRFRSMFWRRRLMLLAGGSLCLSTGVIAQDSAGGTELETIVLEAESDDILVQDGYVAKSDRIGTKTDTPLVRIPQAVSVVTQDQIEDQKPRTLNEALTYTAGANPTNFGYDSRYDAFYLRGFPAYYTGTFRDGLKRTLRPRGRDHSQGAGVVALWGQRSGWHRQHGDEAAEGRRIPRG